ncbi:MAG: gamma-glutamylcyclotransferase family protein [Ginsengibacter sp.]
MENTSLQLFVYSSLRKGFQQQAYEYMVKYFTFVAEGKVKGILRDSETGPVATPTGVDKFIKGELYKLINKENFSFVFGQLDDYEGLSAEQGSPVLYHRELTTVFKEDGSATKAWIYWFTGDLFESPVIESGDVMEYIKSKEVSIV